MRAGDGRGSACRPASVASAPAAGPTQTSRVRRVGPASFNGRRRAAVCVRRRRRARQSGMWPRRRTRARRGLARHIFAAMRFRQRVARLLTAAGQVCARVRRRNDCCTRLCRMRLARASKPAPRARAGACAARGCEAVLRCTAGRAKPSAFSQHVSWGSAARMRSMELMRGLAAVCLASASCGQFAAAAEPAGVAAALPTRQASAPIAVHVDYDGAAQCSTCRCAAGVPVLCCPVPAFGPLDEIAALDATTAGGVGRSSAAPPRGGCGVCSHVSRGIVAGCLRRPAKLAFHVRAPVSDPAAQRTLVAPGPAGQAASGASRLARAAK